jgi:hypothetical protein
MRHGLKNLAWLLLWIVPTLSGCLFRPHHPMMTPVDEVLLASRGHQCTDQCHHYYHDGMWYMIDGHDHGKECGHVFQNGVWVVAK